MSDLRAAMDELARALGIKNPQKLSSEELATLLTKRGGSQKDK